VVRLQCQDWGSRKTCRVEDKAGVAHWAVSRSAMTHSSPGFRMTANTIPGDITTARNQDGLRSRGCQQHGSKLCQVK
jgi:hypothetical protein